MLSLTCATSSRALRRSPALLAGLAATARRCSHIGRTPVRYGQEVTLEHLPPTGPAGVFGPAGTLRVVGPLGNTAVPIQPDASTGHLLTVRVDDANQKQQRAMWGTTRALIANAVHDVTEGYRLSLRLVGVGYRASLEQNDRVLSLKLGYSHSIEMALPEGITATVPNPARIVLAGVDRQLVSQFAASIRRWRVPEPYKQKGIFVGNETIRKKDVKKNKK
ncbi:ribosomal protein L6, alpha-beta domain-containing protein [Syncephalis pseudoplumigaleata]|uniref:Large ribosomal subunit protein uL6m n=1 Tax=Syncephalis pseudoplumigaleata TaxID=1712513 RepID=A0A4P9Z1Z3_9FUNG|nr:ribosomal protein L6, alpha-beta domain-containing protein [Syncephalis pseudoplumigaleata]|eukprot:RKP26513.1 ribosomal protein L6, alpha-beta domain-containing protein [Syncephalis pseudoplumigaleata]